MSLLASAVDVPDDNMDILRKQYKSTQAQALQLLKVWNRDLGGSREELHDLLVSAGFTEAAHRSVSSQLCVWRWMGNVLAGIRVGKASVRSWCFADRVLLS